MTEIQYFHTAFEVFGAIFCLIAAVIVFQTRHLDKKLADLLVFLLITEVIFNLFDLYYGDANFIIFARIYCIALIFFLYVQRLMENNGSFISSKSKILIKILFASAIILLIFSKSFALIDKCLGIAMLAIILFETLKNRIYVMKIEFGALIMINLLPIVGLIVQSYNLLGTASIVLLFLLHEIKYSRSMRDKELEWRLRIYHMQIKPHFIFNSLGVIRSLMVEKSEAKEALDEFSRFLRGSLEIFTEDKLISVSDELKTVKNYLLLQKRRFEEKLTIEMEIEAENFKIPGFAIQILVENAINHGIRQKLDGSGRLKIKIYETTAQNVIEVSDDGVGFDVEAVKLESKRIGLKNLHERLKIMVSGELEIKSEVGKGTTARIIIPKR